MMLALEMYMILAVTLMKTALGLPKTCLHYCKFLPENSSIAPGCNCSPQNVRKTQTSTLKHIAMLKDSEINDDPVNMILSLNTSFDEQPLHMLSFNPIFKSKQNTFKRTKKGLETAADPFAEQDKFDDNIGQSSNQYKRSGTSFPKLMDGTKELPLHLYLDIDITSEDSNSPQLEELKNMFENFQTAEKNLSECINLHIYIFSKSIDTANRTNMNLGRKVQHDNLSNFQQLTEIESKCDQPASIIKQSIYQIKQFLSREDKTAEITLDEQDTVYSTKLYNQIKAQNTTDEFGNVNASDVYPAALSTRLTDDNNNNDVIKNANIHAEATENVQFHKHYSERDGYNLYNNDVKHIKNTDLTSTSSFYQDSTVYDKTNPGATTDPTYYGDLNTDPTYYDTNRTLISEKDLKLPRISTKELSNGTLVSVVDGYEEVPNSDFILTNKDHNIASTPSKDAAIPNTDLIQTNIDKIDPSDVVNIHGKLYFSFGGKQIPARFIQQSDGELDLAIDGFSMCNQMLEHNTSNFINSLCKCIIRKNCTLPFY